MIESVLAAHRRHTSRGTDKTSSDQSLRESPLLGRRLFARRFAVARGSRTLAIPHERHEFVDRTAPEATDRMRPTRNRKLLRRPSRMQGRNRNRHSHFGWMDLDAAPHTATPTVRAGGKEL